MRIFNSLDEVNIKEDSVFTIGKFDGLHRGHKSICEKIISIEKNKGLVSSVITFVDPPSKLTKGEYNRQIVTNEERLLLFKESGFSNIIQCPFDEKLMKTTAKEFIEKLVYDFNMKCLVVGTDFKFGYKGEGDINSLRVFSKEYNFELIVFDKLKEDNEDISSTRIRREIKDGHILKANLLMGRNYFIYGKVVMGRKIGHKIDFPTINIIPSDEKLIPSKGVYYTLVKLEDNVYEGITNVGIKPTFDDDNSLTIETHILDFNENIYDKNVKIVFLEEVRPEIKFDSVDDLKKQLEIDKKKGIEFFNKRRGY